MKVKQLFPILAVLMTVLLWPLTVYASDVDINTTNFPDGNFRVFVEENFDTNGDGVLSDKERNAVTVIDVNDLNLSSLKGIERFGKLTELHCWGNELQSLNVSKNTALTYLDCSSNDLSKLDVSSNTALKILSCSYNSLSSLNVSQNTALTDLICDDNNLSSLDVSNNTALKILSCLNNNLSSLNVSKNISLTVLNCNYNNLSSLDVSKNTALKQLSCSGNKLGSLDVSKNTGLKEMSCFGNKLSSLNVSRNTKLEILYCYANKLASLDVSKNTALVWLFCQNNCLKRLDLTEKVSAVNCAGQSVPAVYSTSGDYYVIDMKNAFGDGLSRMEISVKSGDGSYQSSTGKLKVLKTKIGSVSCLYDTNSRADAQMDITLVPSLSITAQPVSVKKVSGDTAKFTVKAAGSGLTYQWQYQKPGSTTWVNSAASTAKKATFTLTATAARNGIKYRCIVKSGSLKTVSDTVTLHVLAITKQPVSVTMVSGTTAKFTVKAVGQSLTYQWQYQKPGSTTWTNSSASTAKKATFALTATAARDGIKYRCIVKSGSLKKVSDTVTLRVLAITGQPASVTKTSGTTARFTVKAIGPNLTYQWQYQKPGSTTWVNSTASTAKKTTFAVTATAARNGYKYRCIVKSGSKQVVSKTVKLTVK